MELLKCCSEALNLRQKHGIQGYNNINIWADSIHHAFKNAPND